MNWTGYKVHFTETCERKNPNLITNVETTPATSPDGEVTSTVHQKLADKNLLPDEHLVDAAYVDAYQLVESHQDYQRRREQLAAEFKHTYASRAGIEGTISQAVRRFNLRRTRYWGLAKTHLQNVATACAINLSRFFASSNQIPKAQTRTSTLAALRFQGNHPCEALFVV